ncbi:hypothetical protein EV382_1024 [Micromonospora violae]|uniref:Uncharacterized protein n=1 Tax=Micromonospora violae TaxID=1278207 RepID=A0A4Q7U9W4_9ACTN|nr:hypothetical protein [Micromonospora violae]RZT77857.1 hypothetical protein EV382_1024 [Micromonospora violae]
MTVADRLADPLAAVWCGQRTEPPARVLTSPDDAGDLDPDQATSPPHIHLLVAGQAQLGDGHAETSALDGPGSAPCAATTRRSTTPMLFDGWGDQPIRLAINVTASEPAGELVRTLQELSPHEAFPGGPP